VQKRVAKRDAFKATLGGDYNAAAFRAYERDLQRAERSTNNMIRSQGRLRTAFGSVYGRGGAVFAAAGGLYGLERAGEAVISTASDINESLTKNQNLFGSYAKTVERFAKTSATSFGISKKAALEYTGVFGGLARAQGFNEKAAAGMSVQLTKLAADLASFNNTSIDDALQALRSGITGEVEPLRRFGVALSVQAVQAEAARIGLIKLDKSSADYKTRIVNVEKAETARAKALKEHGKDSIEFQDATAKLGRAQDQLGKLVHGANAQLTPQQKILATNSLVMRQTTQAHGDFARTSSGLANQTRILQARLSDIGAQIGAKLLPVVVKAANHLNRFITEIQNGTGEGGRFRDRLVEIGDKLQQVGSFIKDHADLIKLAASAWVSYKVAALASVAASKAAGLAALAGGRSAAGAGAARGAGAVGAGAVGGLGGIAVSVAAFAGLQVVMDQIERRSKRVAAGFEVAANAAKEMVRKGDYQGIQRLSDSIDDWGKKSGATSDEIKRLKAALGDLEKAAERNMGGVGDAVDKAAAHFRDFRRTGSNNLKGIRTATEENMHFIRRTLGDDTAAGKEALARNFRLARTAIRQAMNDGKVSVKEGLGEIQRLMRAELKQYGITGKTASAIIRHGDIKNDRAAAEGTGGAARGGWVRRAAGGWIGERGMVSGDVVPIGDNTIAAFGEYLATDGNRKAVINRHQAPVVDLALAAGGYGSLDTIPGGQSLGMIEQAMAPLGGLDSLFARVTRPHFLATGGRVQGAVASLGSRLSRMFGLSVTSTTGGGHAPGSYHYQGLAEDLGGPASAMSKASQYLMSSGIYRSLLEGIHKPGLSVKNGQVVPSSLWGGVWDQHANHIHIALRALGAAGGGGGAGASGSIAAPRTGASGALGAIVQAALNASARGANGRIGAALAGLGGGDIADLPGGKTSAGGQYNKAQLSALWRRAGGASNMANLMAAIALAESGGNPSIVNSIGATGLWQIHPGGSRYLNPLTNARTAVSKLKSQGLSAWEAYTNGSYRQYLATGGRIRPGSRRISNKKPTLTGSGPQAGSGFTGFRIKPLTNLNRGRSTAYDSLSDHVEDLEAQYSNKDRLFSISVEELTNDDGSINVQAITKRVAELEELLRIRKLIVAYYHWMLQIAERMRKTYKTIISRLRGAVRSTKGKQRTNYKAELANYTTALGDVEGDIKQLRRDQIPNAEIDVVELGREIGEVRGTSADTAAADSSGLFTDTGSDTGTDTGSNADADAQIQRANDIAAGFQANLTAANQVISAFSSSGDIGTGGSNAFNAVANDQQPMGAQFAPGVGASVRTINGTGGTTVINNYNMPGAPNVLRAIGDAATAGQSLQPSIDASVTKLGI
jgi:hypothetical protein